MAEKAIPVLSLKKENVPAELLSEAYFDFRSHPFAHQALFEAPETNSVIAAIERIGSYAKKWLKETIDARSGETGLKALSERSATGFPSAGRFEIYLEEGALFVPAFIWGAKKESGRIYVSRGVELLGANIFLDEGDICIGEGTRIEPGVGIKGPTIIGKNNEIRQGAYLRGNCIIGDGCILRGELKNTVLMDKANFPHPSYLGDSLCGYMTHFGNQATAANLGIFEGIRPREERTNIILRLNGRSYDLGRSKVGIILGDFSQVGCNSVSDPATFLRPYTIVYSLTRLAKGFYGPNEIVKNKPHEKGVIERVPFRR